MIERESRTSGFNASFSVRKESTFSPTVIRIAFHTHMLPGTFEYTLSYRIDHERGSAGKATQAETG